MIPSKSCDMEPKFPSWRFGNLVGSGDNTDKIQNRRHLIYHVAKLEEKKENAWSIRFAPANGLRNVLKDKVVACLGRLKFTLHHFFSSFMEEQLKEVLSLLARGLLDSNLVANGPETCPMSGRPLDLRADWKY